MAAKLYLTTTLPYVNAEPHLGFALELVQADVVARYHQLLGREVFFNTGADEHGVKIYRRAQEARQEPQKFVDQMAGKFQKLLPALGILPEANFIRTTEPHHLKAAQEFWRRCDKAGDIYKKAYQLKYCAGCELEKIESELENGRCPDHPHLEPEIIEEENYFFRFSRYQKQLLELYEEQPDFVVPATRFNEVKKFVERGLEDFSVSRLKSKMPWGVAVPSDSEQVMYVWFDALVNYISVLGWPEDERKFDAFWRNGKPTQFAGKNNLRQQAAMWQAMLMSAGLPPSRQIVIHGFITLAGRKMSKSLGNVLDPFELVREYGTDAVRYFLLRHVNQFEDTDVTLVKFKEAYNAHLANGLGNLVSRVMKLAEDYLNQPVVGVTAELPPAMVRALDNFEFNQAADFIWRQISDLDLEIQNTKPFEIVKTDLARGREMIGKMVFDLGRLAAWLTPFMPQTSSAILTAIASNQKPTSLFPRK